MKVIYGDERCTFICQKINEDIPDVQFVFDEVISNYPLRNAEYLIECKEKYENSNQKNLKQKVFDLACLLGWKRIRPFIKNKAYLN